MELELSKTCVPFQGNGISRMTKYEILALQRFKSQYNVLFEPLHVLKMLYDYDYVSNGDFTYILEMFRGQSRGDNLQVLLSIIPYYCTFSDLQHALFCSGNEHVCTLLTETLHRIHLESRVWRIYRTDCANREKIHIFFKDVKRMVHEAKFGNMKQFLREMANKFRDKLNSKAVQGNEREKQVIADKYVALMGAEIDAHAITFDDHLPQHMLFRELDGLTVHTSNTVLTNVIYFGRLANAYAIAGQFDKSYDMLGIAQCHAATCGPSLELANMHYIDVYVKLWEYEYNPTENLRKELMKAGWFGLCSLENETNEDIKKLWRRMFILRMVFCLLGIGNRANVFKDNNQIPQKCIDEADKLLNKVDEMWEEIETRREMFYYVARARLNALTGDDELAIEYISRARQCATDGHFKELSFILEYQMELIQKYRLEITYFFDYRDRSQFLQFFLHNRGLKSVLLHTMSFESFDFNEILMTESETNLKQLLIDNTSNVSFEMNSDEGTGSNTVSQTELKVLGNAFCNEEAQNADSGTNTNSMEDFNRKQCQNVNLDIDSNKTENHFVKYPTGLQFQRKDQIYLRSFRYDPLSEHFTQLLPLEDNSMENKETSDNDSLTEMKKNISYTHQGTSGSNTGSQNKRSDSNLLKESNVYHQGVCQTGNDSMEGILSSGDIPLPSPDYNRYSCTHQRISNVCPESQSFNPHVQPFEPSFSLGSSQNPCQWYRGRQNCNEYPSNSERLGIAKELQGVHIPCAENIPKRIPVDWNSLQPTCDSMKGMLPSSDILNLPPAQYQFSSSKEQNDCASEQFIHDNISNHWAHVQTTRNPDTIFHSDHAGCFGYYQNVGVNFETNFASSIHSITSDSFPCRLPTDGHISASFSQSRYASNTRSDPRNSSLTNSTCLVENAVATFENGNPSDLDKTKVDSISKNSSGSSWYVFPPNNFGSSDTNGQVLSDLSILDPDIMFTDRGEPEGSSTPFSPVI